MSKKIIYALVILSLLFASYFYFSEDDISEVAITAVVKKGTFKNEIIISGEAQSTSLKEIKGPVNLRKFKLRNIKIQDLIPEGTVVKKGDYVGRLDPSDVNEQIIDARLNLESAESKYTQKELDTTLTLKQDRNGILDLKFSMEEISLELKQSIYEPPATIRKLEINLEKAERELKEKKENYRIKRRKAEAQMVEVGTEVAKYKKQLSALQDLVKSFTIISESDGMITYVREWNGNKRKVGSTISPWNPAIANLPDLSKMESKTYANEVDIRKIKTDLPVTIGFDAFPELELTGTVKDVANVGEKKSGSDIKIFQILIHFDETNNNIKPGMTTSNKILTFSKDSVLTIPIEAVFSKDSISYVYKKDGFSVEKKQIELGESNNNEIIVKKGIQEKDVVYLNKPDGYEEKKISLLK